MNIVTWSSCFRHLCTTMFKDEGVSVYNSRTFPTYHGLRQKELVLVTSCVENVSAHCGVSASITHTSIEVSGTRVMKTANSGLASVPTEENLPMAVWHGTVITYKRRHTAHVYRCAMHVTRIYHASMYQSRCQVQSYMLYSY